MSRSLSLCRAVVSCCVGLVVAISTTNSLAVDSEWDRQSDRQLFDCLGPNMTQCVTWPNNREWSESETMGPHPFDAGRQTVLRPGNWTTASYPDNDRSPGVDYDVTISPSGDLTDLPVELDVDVSVNNLTVDVGAQLDLRFNKTLTIDNSSTITNNGVIHRIPPVGSSNNQFRFVGDVLLTGSGVMQLSEDSLRGDSGGATETFTNVSTIEGRGSFSSLSELINLGRIQTNHPQGIAILISTPTTRNSGTLRAFDGGLFTISSTVENQYNDVDGLVEVSDGSTIRLNGIVHRGLVQVTGTGVLNMSGSLSKIIDSAVGIGDTSTLRVSAGLGALSDNVIPRLDANTVVSPGGTIDIQGGDRLRLFSLRQYQNDGLIHLRHGSPTSAELVITDEVVLDGSGTVFLEPNTRIRGVSGAAAASHLVNESNRIHGAGALQSMAVTNRGTIEGDDNKALRISTGTLNAWFRNEGSLLATGSGGVDIGSGTFINVGTVRIDAASRLDRTGIYRQNDGETIVNGTLTATTMVDVNAGRFSGSGHVDANLQNDGGVVAPGQSLGTLTVEGDYSQQSAATLEIEIGGTSSNDFDHLEIVDGSVSLAGTLSFSFVDLGSGQYQPTAGDSFKFLTLSSGNLSLTGHFDSLLGPTDNGLSWFVDYGPSSATLVSTFAADFDHDGDVDGDDLTVWQAAYGAGNGSDADGDSDGADFLAWQQQFGSGVALADTALPVPEPLSLAGWLFAFCSFLSRPLSATRAT